MAPGVRVVTAATEADAHRNGRLAVGSVGVERLDADTAELHRLYVRMGFMPTGERELPDDVNDTREYGFERTV
jgi:hypothetical protein